MVIFYVVFRNPPSGQTTAPEAVVGLLEVARPLRSGEAYAAAVAAWQQAHPELALAAGEYLRIEPWSSCSRRAQDVALSCRPWNLPQ